MSSSEQEPMTEMKYVVVRRGESTIEEMYIFPKHIDHDRFAEVLSHIKEGYGSNWHRSHAEVISAGFTDGVGCYGQSITLKLKSRTKEDTELLKQRY